MEVEIGRGKKGRRAYGFDDIAIVPSRRTRDPDDVDISWTLGPYRFELPLLASAMDGVVSPATAAELGALGGLGVLNLEGIWSRYEDAEAKLAEIAEAPKEQATALMQEIYAEPVKAGADRPAGRGDQGRRGGRRRVADPAAGDRVLRGRDRGRARHPRHPGHGDLGRARLLEVRAAEPEGVHRRGPGPVHRRRLRLVLDRPAPDAHRRGRRPGRGRPGRRLHHARRARARRPAGDGDRRRRRGARPAHARDRRVLQRDRRRRHAHRRRRLEGDRLRRRRGDDRLAAGARQARRPAAATTGGWRPSIPRCRAAPGSRPCRTAPWRRS